MAVVGTAIISKYLSNSEAEEAFQPWWDTLENYAVYGLIVLGNDLKTFVS